MANPLFRPQKFQWVPGLLIIASALIFLEKGTSFRMLWLVMASLSMFIVILGIINHIRFTRIKDKTDFDATSETQRKPNQEPGEIPLSGDGQYPD